jgi:transposase
MDGSREHPHMTAGLDLGDKYRYLCLIDQHSDEVMEEGRLRTSPETFKRRFASERPMRIAIETGTHSPWVSRLLEECGHEVLVANARKLKLIYSNKRKTDEIDAENLARLVAGGAVRGVRAWWVHPGSHDALRRSDTSIRRRGR